MDKISKVKSGYWSIATQKHLKEFRSDCSNIDELDCLNISGKAGRFLGAIRGNRQIDNVKKIEKMGNLVGIGPRELKTIILPEIERASDKQVELIRDNTGNIIGIEEYIFTNEDVMAITGEVFEIQNPSDIQRIAIETMDETKKIPYYQNEMIEMLCGNGFKESDITLSLALQEQFKLIAKVNKSNRPNPIISNEYVWGGNHEKIAKAIADIDIGRKQYLKETIEKVQNFQGYPTEKLTATDFEVLNLAKKVGMLNPTTIVSSRGLKKEFVFSPNMIQPLTYNDDILDDVKLFLASIRFGENYTQHTTIYDAIKFLEYLIRNGDIGPHSANGTDYTLLEKKGIVKVVNKQKIKYGRYGQYIASGYCLELVRKDVAEEALKVLSSPQHNISFDKELSSFEMINDTGDFISPECSRIELRMAQTPEYIKEAEEHFSKVLRDELL